MIGWSPTLPQAPPQTAQRAQVYATVLNSTSTGILPSWSGWMTADDLRPSVAPRVVAAAEKICDWTWNPHRVVASRIYEVPMGVPPPPAMVPPVSLYFTLQNPRGEWSPWIGVEDLDDTEIKRVRALLLAVTKACQGPVAGRHFASILVSHDGRAFGPPEVVAL